MFWGVNDARISLHLLVSLLVCVWGSVGLVSPSGSMCAALFKTKPSRQGRAPEVMTAVTTLDSAYFRHIHMLVGISVW